MSLDIEKTYRAIVEAARQRRFATYGELAAASDVKWSQARYALPQQLGRIVQIAHARGWPMLSAIVVNKDSVETGAMEGQTLEGFLGTARMLGIDHGDPQAFLRQQQVAVFAWAETAPDALDAEEKVELAGGGGGPRFVRYFGPVLDGLRDLGGEAPPSRVFTWIKDRFDISAEELAGINKGGQSKFENKVAWARFYLAKAGMIDSTRRGVWALTAEGRDTALDHASALELFKSVRSQFKTSDDDDAPAPVSDWAPFDDPDRRFWFVGAVWDRTDDQLDRFLADGIWQDGDDRKNANHVNRMKPGDRIAIKASFVKKHRVPFDNRGRPVSCMRLKAVGTITENLGDGRTVRVDWTRLEPPRDWYFYTYRVTVVEADPNDELARRLIAFAFAGAVQDYDFWLTEVPYFAQKYGKAARPVTTDTIIEPDDLETEEEAAAPSYTIDSIAGDGCFLPRPELEGILRRIEAKKNLVLQGPPGTGKTWLAKRLAYALIGSKERRITRDRLRVVQFHPSLAYEDFVRGWRPAGDGTLALVDGIFLEAVAAALAEPDRPFVLVIEEINRGNPAQIFGELLTLLEDSKRSRDEAIELAYRREQGERVHVPANLFIIGTMNIADRSLALVDLALRRRFAFVNLEPQLNGLWQDWCVERGGLGTDDVALIQERLTTLNREVEEDRSLGPQYRIGHSYVTPRGGSEIADGRGWFRAVVETEIAPLLEEYWFDAPEKAAAATRKLLDGI